MVQVAVDFNAKFIDKKTYTTVLLSLLTIIKDIAWGKKTEHGKFGYAQLV